MNIIILLTMLKIHGRIRLAQWHQLTIGMMAVPYHHFGREGVFHIVWHDLVGNGQRLLLSMTTYSRYARDDGFGDHSGPWRYGASNHDSAMVLLRRIWT